VRVDQTQPVRLKVLVVDDDPEVLKVASAALREEGHVVLRAASAREALALLEAHTDIALLFTDIVMPGSMDGFDLAEQAKLRRPGLHVLYMSGYLRDEGVWNGSLLRKPWTKDDLKSALAEILPGADPRRTPPRRRR
jgi:CheY-like chemotaxis protein